MSVRREDHLDQIRSIAGRVARSYGLEIFDVQLRRESVGWVLRITLDRLAPTGGADESGTEESVTLADCQRVSGDLDAVFDAELELDHAYTLEVSSPGLDRPLRHLDDCRRFVGRLAKIVTSGPIDGQRQFEGRITEVENGTVLLAIGTRRRRIPWDAVTKAQLEVEFWR